MDDDEIDSLDTEISVSRTEGYKYIAGWLCNEAPALSKLGKRKAELERNPEPEFSTSRWIDLQNAAISKGFYRVQYVYLL